MMDFHAKLSPDERLVFVSILIVSLVALAGLVLLVRNGYLSHLDQSILGGFHKLKHPMLDHFFSGITWLGSLWVLLPLYLVLVWVLSDKIPYFERVMGIGFFGAVITTYALKFILERKRPHFYGVISELPLDPAFPSAHTTQVIAFSLLLWILLYSGATAMNLLLSVSLLAVAVSVAISRMYLQVHYPTDVAAGVLIALAWSSIAVLTVKPGGAA